MISTSPLAGALRSLWPSAAAPHKQNRTLIELIRADAQRLQSEPHAALAAQMDALKQRVATGMAPTHTEVLHPAFALIVEAARRVLGIELYDCQLLAGLALARGGIAEMQTGEGKTFSALLPAALHALSGAGVHLMTVNAYLAQRDYELLAPCYRLLGLTVGAIASDDEPIHKRAAYACDITYGMGCEFGFDFLRDAVTRMSQRQPRLGEGFRSRLRGAQPAAPLLMQRGHAVAIVDEADSVMIDEATTPLILAAGGNAESPHAEVYVAARHFAQQLVHGQHYTLQEAVGQVQWEAAGKELLAARSDVIPRRGLVCPWQVYVEQALRAEHLYRADVHYIVTHGEIQLVDQYTGRIFTDRTWRDGLQQAVQAKEGITITTETHSLARITRQRYFRLYEHLCGMTGTAQGSESELRSVFGLAVAVIGPHRPSKREVLPLRAFATAQLKEQAIAESVAQVHATGQPVLVGTPAIETSQRIAGLLDLHGIAYQLLNGKQDAEEAAIIARAGELRAVTIATNMAGRGTDVKLTPAALERGGLHVIVTEPQESARVDRQLMGRAARQGDPGTCQLFLAANDSLLTRHDPALAARLLQAAAVTGEVAAADDFARAIARLQARIETKQAQNRRQMYAHDDWLDSILRDLT